MSLQSARESVEKKFYLMQRALDLVLSDRTSKPGLIISGPQGIGKSHLVMRLAAEQERDFEYVKGHITPLRTFEILRKHKTNGLIIFDDADAVFANVTCMNLLKAAMDPTTKYEVVWDSRAAGDEPVFTFKGRILVITNARLRISPHYNALVDRFHYFSFDLSQSEIKAYARKLADAKLDEGFEPAVVSDVYDWFVNAAEGHLTFRTFDKALELAAEIGENWQEFLDYMILND